MNGGERPDHRLSHLAPFLRGEGLTLQHIGQTLLDRLHDGVDDQGIVEMGLANFGNADQVGIVQVLRGAEARNDFIRIRQSFGKADGGG